MNRRFWGLGLGLTTVVMLVGCAPQRLVVTKPVPVVETRTVVEKVDRALCDTRGHVMPTGPLARAPQVAAQRRDLLEKAWGRLDAICRQHSE